MLRCEIAVVGGGPAGSTAARFLASAGRDVHLFEADPSPRDKVCGGGLRPSVLSAFPHVRDLSDRFLEATTTRGVMSTPGGPEISYTSSEGEPPIMYQARRSVFDRVLLDDAIDAGAQVHEGTKVVGAAGGEKGWTLRTEDGTEVKARGVIGAGGAKCPLGRRMRCAARGTTSFPKERLAIAWAREFEVGEDFVDEAYGPERLTRVDLREANMTGYAWAFPKRDHVNVGFGALVTDLRNGVGKFKGEAYANRLVGMGLLPEQPTGGAWKAAPIPMGGPEGPVSRPGALSLGDGAGLVSPLSGDGIYYAIRSGELAASTMDDALDRGDLTANAMSVYRRAFKKEFGKELSILMRVAKKLRTEPMEMLRRAERDPKIPPLVLQMFQGEGDIRRTALRLYGKTVLAGLRR
ncbi:MAG: NAD(P)/FAD-dependent oxidoreductase [Thermoplasmata archaeon]|nr:MAG: NAD(P)/FAD-dependent oxidoreductase [Thermoplasmata archaeon]